MFAMFHSVNTLSVIDFTLRREGSSLSERPAEAAGDVSHAETLRVKNQKTGLTVTCGSVNRKGGVLSICCPCF